MFRLRARESEVPMGLLEVRIGTLVLDMVEKLLDITFSVI